MPQEEKVEGGYEKREMLSPLVEGCLKLEGSNPTRAPPLEGRVLLLASTLGQRDFITRSGPPWILKGHTGTGG